MPSLPGLAENGHHEDAGQIGANQWGYDDAVEAAQSSPTFTSRSTTSKQLESTSLADIFGYYGDSKCNTMALVRKMVHEDDTPDAKDILISNEIAAQVRKKLDNPMLSRPILDFLVKHFVTKVNWMDQLLYTPWFLVQYQKWWNTDRMSSVAQIEFSILTLRICFYALQFLPSPTYASDSIKGVALSDIRKSCEEVISALGPICARLDPRGSLIRVQHLALAGLSAICRGQMNSFWESLSCATRVAQQIGLHRDTIVWPSSVDELEKEMSRRTFCNLYIWDSCLSRRLDRIPFLQDGLSPDIMPRMNLLSEGDVGADAPDMFLVRILRSQLAEFWRKHAPAKGSEYDPIATEKRYDTFCTAFLRNIHPVFALHPDKQWDERLPTLPMQRQLLHMAIFECLYWNFRPALLLTSDQMGHLPMYKRILISHNKNALAVAALNLLQGVFNLHMMMGGSHIKYPGAILPLFEAAVPLLCLCAEKGFPADIAEDATQPLETDPLAVGNGSLTRAKCMQAARDAQTFLQSLADASTTAEVGARTLARLIGRADSTPTVTQTRGSSTGAADLFTQVSQPWSSEQLRGPPADYAFSNPVVAPVAPDCWEKWLEDLTNGFGLEETNGFLDPNTIRMNDTRCFS